MYPTAHALLMNVSGLEAASGLLLSETSDRNLASCGPNYDKLASPAPKMDQLRFWGAADGRNSTRWSCYFKISDLMLRAKGADQMVNAKTGAHLALDSEW